MKRLSSFFSLGTEDLFAKMPQEGWKQRAPAPNNLLAFNFNKQHENDKKMGAFVLSLGAQKGFLVVTFRVVVPLGGFIIKESERNIKIVNTEPYNKLQVQDTEEGFGLEIFDAFDIPKNPHLNSEQVQMVSGLLAVAANAARLSNIAKSDDELRRMSGQ